MGLRHYRRLIIGSQVRALVRPPSSLRKPRVSSTTSNRAFLRAFPATQFPDSGLCERSRILVAAFGALSLRSEIPFPAAEARAGFTRLHPQFRLLGPPSFWVVRTRLKPYSGFCTAVNSGILDRR